MIVQTLRKYAFVAIVTTCLVLIITPPAAASGIATESADNIYATYGTHNDSASDKCEPSDCVYPRAPEAPTDPEFPIHWTSDWNMHRVFNKFAEFPPPYDGYPPGELEEGVDYETSTGTTYYDSEWTSQLSRWPGKGAMRETYENRCLPIFPIDNHYSCSFVSLGDNAIFQTYEKDRPAAMPEYCLFSPQNHPPRRDFISHLPYSKGDSARLDNRVQGYSFWVGGAEGKPIQTGVAPYPSGPDPSGNPSIMFGYAFWSESSPDIDDLDAVPYRHPQSFYFSGFPAPPANAPIVSQNYTDFSMRQPAADVWSDIEALIPKSLPACHLFSPEADTPAAHGTY